MGVGVGLSELREVAGDWLESFTERAYCFSRKRPRDIGLGINTIVFKAPTFAAVA